MHSVKRLLQINSYWQDFCTYCTIILFRRVLFCALEKRGNQNVYFLIGGNQCILLKRVKSMSTFEEGRYPCVLLGGYQLVDFENGENQCALLKGVEIKV